MRIAFYAPLKSPAHPSPSGDRRVARLYLDALRAAGCQVELASELRSHDPVGDAVRQHELRLEGERIGRALVQRWRDAGPEKSPHAWFTYHVYYKAVDWIGPYVCRNLSIPYVIAEASFAAKRAAGPWQVAHLAALEAMRQAAVVLCPTRDDMAGVALARGGSEGLVFLPPFLEPSPYRNAVVSRSTHRQALAARFDLSPQAVWLAVSAMMRAGDKLLSYRALADALRLLGDMPIQVLVAGDGVARDEVRAVLQAALPGRVHFAGQCAAQEMAAFYAACDLCVWPGVNEAYGMAMLEAQAAGLPVVSCLTRGVPDVVCDGTTGLLARPGDPLALANCVRDLVLDAPRRESMGTAAADFVQGQRSLAQAAQALRLVLARAVPQFRALQPIDFT
jgi:glycosyltransferase involved in cell wall biosynthesis